MSDPSLRELQRWMKARIRPSGETPRSLVRLNRQRGTPGEERLSVYVVGYRARTREALAEVYEAIHHVLGERVFSELTDAYAAQHPSHDYNLSVFGRHLPDFLTRSPLSEPLPFLPDLAQLEWLVSKAFHAFEQPPMNGSELSSLSVENWNPARLIFQRSVGLVASAWPILEIWDARMQPREQMAIDVVDRPQRVLVRRQDLATRCELLDERQYQVLEGLLAGRPLGTVCGKLAMRVGDEPPPLADWFARWAGLGLIVRCELARDA